MIDFGIKDVVDIVLVAMLLYYIYNLMKRSSAVNLFSGVMVFIVMWIVVSQIFAMRLLGTILDKVISLGSLALVVLFQEEIRRFLSSIGNNKNRSFLLNLFRTTKKDETHVKDIMPIIMACNNMSRQKVGALIVMERSIGLSEFASSGEEVDAKVSQRLIENIFFKNSPLHDGAMIIRNMRIAAAGCILPVSHSTDIPKSLGLRHRAALGLSQKTDALAIVVSEETGGISIAYEGEFRLDLTVDQLEYILSHPHPFEEKVDD